MNSVYIKGNTAVRQHAFLLNLMGRGFTEDELKLAVAMKYEATTCSDKEEFTRHTLLGADGKEIAQRVVNGY
jgi:hypothetical protein